jgi:hypothetical protein
MRSLIGLLIVTTCAAQPTSVQVQQSLTHAVQAFTSRAASHGGYLYRYSADFTLREAEGIPAADTIWIQPPGTPAVGMACLDAAQATQDVGCLNAAIAAARAVARTQLCSGGWDYSGHFDAVNRATHLYRRDAEGQLITRAKVPTSEAGWHVWRQRQHHDTNHSTLDDDVTQSATRLLIRVDHAMQFKDAEIHEAALFALRTLLLAQYPNGAWSASFDTLPASAPDAQRYPKLAASYPSEWSRTWTKDFTGCYVTNDNLHATLIRTLLLAGEVYQDKDFTAAAMRAGDFLIAAQMPPPQPAWAQQYDAAMQPVWSRAFEPPAISGRESQSMMWSLITLAASTGEARFLAPIDSAAAYLRSSALPDGRLARFYELQTNKPLYFQRGKGGKGHQLTHSDAKTASNYGWKWDSELEAMLTAKQQVIAKSSASKEFPPPVEATDADVQRVLSELNKDHLWTETTDTRGTIRNADAKKTSPPSGVVHSDTFVKNVELLARWLRKHAGQR